MPKLRLRQAAPVALVAMLLLTLSACGLTEYPNTTFHQNTEFNRAVDALFDRLVQGRARKHRHTEV